jgi:hypothetical protein
VAWPGRPDWVNLLLLGDCLLLAIVKVQKFIEHIFGLFFHGTSYVPIYVDKKIGWVTFWATFSQTHLRPVL